MAFGDKLPVYSFSNVNGVVKDEGIIDLGLTAPEAAIPNNGAAPTNPNWLNKTPEEVLADVNYMLTQVCEAGLIPLPTEKAVRSGAVACCDDTFNFAVEFQTGKCYCLKCRKEMTREHFMTLLDRYAAEQKR